MGEPMKINPKMLKTGDFMFGQTLGEGAYARVVHAKLKEYPTNQFAIKIMEKNHIKKENKVKYVMMEKAVLARLNHTFIIRLLYTFQDASNLYMCMEMLPGGELLHYILKMRREKEAAGCFGEACDLAATKFYIGEIVEGIEYMHREKVIHRDMKPENVMLTATGHVKIGDFGTAMVIKDKDSRTRKQNVSVSRVVGEAATAPSPDADENEENEERCSFVGTAEYVSPEILQDKEVTPAADMWAIGCIAFQMLVGKPAFRGESEYLTFQNIITHCDKSQPLAFPPSVTSHPTAESLIAQLLQPEASARYGPAEDGEPDIESGNRSITKHAFFEGITFGTGDLEQRQAPYEPDPRTFPSTDNMFDGSSDDWQMGVEPTVINNSSSQNDAEVQRQMDSQRMNAEQDKFKIFLDEGEQQVLCAAVYKRKGLFSKKRQLILTDRPRLIYADAEKMELKGAVPWTPSFPISVNIVSFTGQYQCSTLWFLVLHICMPTIFVYLSTLCFCCCLFAVAE